MTTLIERVDDFGRPAWIALMVVSFILCWPIGLIILGFLDRERTNGMLDHGTLADDRWQRKMDKMQRGADRMQDGIGRMQEAAQRWSGGGAPPRPVRRVRRAATTPLTNTATRRCAGSKTSSGSSWSSSNGCAMPRTRPSSTSSWPSAAARPRPRPPAPQY